MIKAKQSRWGLALTLALALTLNTGCLRLTEVEGPSGSDAAVILRPETRALAGAQLKSIVVESGDAVHDAPVTTRLIRQVVDKSKAAIVNIYIKTRKPYRLKLKPVSLFGGLKLSLPGEGLGSGFFIHPAGYLLTNNHVIEDAEEIKIQTADGKDYEAIVLARDPVYDLALLKTKTPPTQLFPALPMGDSSLASAGDMVVAIGNPLGLGHTVTSGIISQTGRSLAAKAEPQGRHAEYIQTDTAINPGSSGGPLITLGGAWIAVNTARLAKAEGIGFSVPSAQVRKFLESILNGKGALEQ